jgi:cytochrome bd-type quinol oxidase subunit 2
MIDHSDEFGSEAYPPLQPETDHRRYPLFSLVIALITVAIHAVVIVGYLTATMSFGARCEQSFRDFKLKLDGSSQLVIGEVRWLYNYWYVAAIMLVFGLVLDGLIVFVLCRSPRSRGWSYVWAVLVVVLLMLLAAFTALSLYMPYQRLLEGLNR